ncbi:hypothetical protein C8R44DRAFT_789851 [Mycena epipterygia]|nr:hypothetical protein C8R44DRAFT_789851 [Mycena epipterygia]
MVFIERIYRHSIKGKHVGCRSLPVREMTDIFEFYGICLGTTILTVFFLSTHCWIFPQRRPIHHRTLADVHRLLNPSTTSTETLLRSRASANARLLHAFHLTNTFVSPDPATHLQFLRKSMTLLRVAKSDWKSFAGIAMQAVELDLPAITTSFHTFVRSVTLRTVVVGLLDPNADTNSRSSGDVDIVAELITDIWLLSKKPGKVPEHLLQMLNQRLRRLVPDEAAYPNPLDFVIPAWETLWRVVAVTLAYVHTDAAACRAFQDLNANPLFLNFRAPKLNATSPSVEDYITESLRRLPPALPCGPHPSPH